MCSPRSSLLVLYGPQGNSLGLLYALANKFTVFSQVYSTTGKQVSPPSSPSAALANFLYQPTLCLMQNFSPITYPSKGTRWLLCECELVTIAFRFKWKYIQITVWWGLYKLWIGGFHVTSSTPCWWTVNKRTLISSFCLSTSICSFHHCYLCLLRLDENLLLRALF